MVSPPTSKGDLTRRTKCCSWVLHGVSVVPHQSYGCIFTVRCCHDDFAPPTKESFGRKMLLMTMTNLRTAQL